MIFLGVGVRSWHHFSRFLGCLFQDRFLIVLAWVLGLIFELFGGPSGVYFEGFGGSDLGSILGWFLGWVWVLPKSRAGHWLGAIWVLAGALRKQKRLLIFEHRPLNEGQ